MHSSDLDKNDTVLFFIHRALTSRAIKKPLDGVHPLSVCVGHKSDCLTRRCDDGISTVMLVKNFIKRDNPIVCPGEAQAVSLLNLEPVIPREANLQDGLGHSCFCLNCMLNIEHYEETFVQSQYHIHIIFTIFTPRVSCDAIKSICCISWNWQVVPWGLYTPTLSGWYGPLTYISIACITPSHRLGFACKTLLVIYIVNAINATHMA